ncbi:MAG: ABC transporter substrate-binding protein [Candidatus Omnitrophica bacterium]|nr:ABC transporter substrate-binding protein [Candidatus Omnitrophota bacterium]
MKNLTSWISIAAFVFILALNEPAAFGEDSVKIRVGHFPNVTHAPALIARATHHFEKVFGESVKIDWKTFNAGPEAIEALFAGEIDILYVGPNPAVNGFVRSRGEALRIIAGVAGGGVALVVRPEAKIERFEDIQGKRVASPQKGNTQDVALLHLMKQKGLAPRTQGGNVEIFNISGGDQITAFAKNQVDAIWTVEPWVSRLVSEANGRILFEERDLWPEGKYATTVLVARKKFMDQHPELVQKWIEGHVEITDYINQNLGEAKKIFNKELQYETGKFLPASYLDQSFERIVFTSDPMESSVQESAKRAKDIGYLGRNEVDLKNLYELSFLEKAKNKSSKG